MDLRETLSRVLRRYFFVEVTDIPELDSKRIVCSFVNKNPFSKESKLDIKIGIALHLSHLDSEMIEGKYALEKTVERAIHSVVERIIIDTSRMHYLKKSFWERLKFIFNPK